MVSQVAAETAPTCPNKGSDPNKFCPVGMIWDEEKQKCLLVV